MKHLVGILALFAILMTGALAFGADSPAPISIAAPAAEELARTAEINEWLDANRAAQEASRVQQRWVGAGVFLALSMGFISLVRCTLRSNRSPAFKRSRILLWAPSFLLASAWWFPPSLLLAMALAPALLWAWWKSALSRWELTIASALYLCVAGGLWAVFSALAGLASQGAGK